MAQTKVNNGKKSPWGQWALSIQPKIPVISVGTSNGTDHFGLVRPEYSGPALKVVLFDRSGHFGRSDRNVPFHLTKLLSPVPLFCILLARTITKRAVAWVGSVEPECTVPLNTENFRNFKPEFLLNGKRPMSYQTSSKRSLLFCLLIGARKLLCVKWQLRNLPFRVYPMMMMIMMMIPLFKCQTVIVVKNRGH